MAKYFASDRRAVEVEIEGVRTGATQVLRADSKGFYEVSDSRTAKALKDSGFVEASLMGVGSGGTGFLCSGCGFNGWFAVCGKCGTDNKVVTDVDA